MELPPMIARRIEREQRESIDNPPRGVFGQELANKLTGAQNTLAFPEPSALELDTRGKVSAGDDRETAAMFRS